MSAERAAAASMRRLRRDLMTTWTTAWFLGIGVFATIAGVLSYLLRETNFNSDLEVYATAAYGLTYFDEEGRFHDEDLVGEGNLAPGRSELWVLGPGDPPEVFLAPEFPMFGPRLLADAVREAMETEEPVERDGRDPRGEDYRLYALPSYGADNVPRAAIVVISDPDQLYLSHQSFVFALVVVTLSIGGLGLVVAMFLTRRSTQPVIEALDQRERFLIAAAHELRTPIATLRAICESAGAGDEEAGDALDRARAITERTCRLVDDLLLFARLEAGTTTLEREPVRLDLLVEAAAAEDERVVIEGDECIAEVDPRLTTVAVSNLIDNALRHAENGEVRVWVRPGSVVVLDEGPGYPPEILAQGNRGWGIAPSRTGSGIGLATVRMIANLHDGELHLSNPGGARAELVL